MFHVTFKNFLRNAFKKWFKNLRDSALGDLGIRGRDVRHFNFLASLVENDLGSKRTNYLSVYYGYITMSGKFWSFVLVDIGIIFFFSISGDSIIEPFLLKYSKYFLLYKPFPHLGSCKLVYHPPGTSAEVPI